MKWICVPGCDYAVSYYHTRVGGKMLCKFVCDPCSKQKCGKKCPNIASGQPLGSWCDCQHRGTKYEER